MVMKIECRKCKHYKYDDDVCFEDFHQDNCYPFMKDLENKKLVFDYDCFLDRWLQKKEKKRMKYQIKKPFTIADIIKLNDDPNCAKLWKYIKMMGVGEVLTYTSRIEKRHLSSVLGYKEVVDFLIQHDLIEEKLPEIELMPGSIWQNDFGRIMFIANHANYRFATPAQYAFIELNDFNICNAFKNKKDAIEHIKIRDYKFISNSLEGYYLEGKNV